MGCDSATGQARRGDSGAGNLTAREVEVLRFAAMGLPNNQIAARLGISRRTVDDHLSVMLRRAHARDRGEMIARGYAAEILLGWPPHWSGKLSLLIRQGQGCCAPDVQAAPPPDDTAVADAQRVSENPARNTRCSVTSNARFLDTFGSTEQFHANRGETVLAAPEPPRATRATRVLVGYARASTRDEHLNHQIDALRAVGCSSIVAEHSKNGERHELRRLLDAVRPGDVVVVASLGRLSRSLKELLSLVAEMRSRGVGLRALRESLDTTAPGGRLIFDVFAALEELLHELITERTHEGLAIARSHGRFGGRPTVMTPEKIAAARALLPETTIAAVARQIGVSRGTLYAHMDAITAARRQSNSTTASA
jgi:DNA invertase Pin-like site-specific DNA recombinase/DNA-binding CsgD family transcriptional regulator